LQKSKVYSSRAELPSFTLAGFCIYELAGLPVFYARSRLDLYLQFAICKPLSSTFFVFFKRKRK